MAALMNHTVLPPATDDQDGIAVLRDVLADHAEIALLTSDGAVELPESVRQLLVDAVDVLARGQAVTIEPRRKVLTTQEAAELLGITRPTFVRLLENGVIPYTAPGRHRRVELTDVLDFQQRERERRRRVLDEMAHEADSDPDDATDRFYPTR
ncbi:helix-turn-helix domain-containing protein [Rhodococcus sp. ABRD24]|uniref:helix-turn-helix domain-containing protein n=1 Tax=Rhodococcus sp. ABRD24 TaxID=2507582 RepID=UPI00103B7EAE|nr:helix-turn-helix domain-containing protein [Rhodococcus sp. ABRD24]QBJ96033.1 helix-turn-helix domain-containing protein [Rhodococcus sp. ABRD24]